MSHILAEFPKHRATSGRGPHARTQESRSYQIDELSPAPSPVQNRRYILRTFVLAPVLVCLAVYATVEMPEIITRTGALLGGTQGSAEAAGTSLLASATSWLPILLMLLSASVLVSMGFTALRGRGQQHKSQGPRLVSMPIQPLTAETAAPAQAAASGKPFLVARGEQRHAAQEEIRLNRDAHASAVQRAAAVSRLRIKAASPTFQPLEAVEPSIRFRTLPRRREFTRDRKQLGFEANSADTSRNPPPPAIA